MQRFTISLDDMLAAQFDALITSRGHSNPSEASHDLLITQIDHAHLHSAAAFWCVVTINYVYNHQNTVVAQRVLSLQHLASRSGHHESAHSPGPYRCLETVVFRGPTREVNQLSELLVALRGVRHGTIHPVPLNQDAHEHKHKYGSKAAHIHLKPVS